jgi:DNA mismatch endonuclease (patch repair protein)
MADVFDKETRSAVMSKVHSKGNKSTELRLIEIFAERGIKGWRRNYPVKGHPDFVFPKKRIAVFVDGCFWHGHDCRNTRPKQNEDFWAAKRERNIKRDIATTEAFEKRSWTVLRIWECELKKKNLPILYAKLDGLFIDGLSKV